MDGPLLTNQALKRFSQSSIDLQEVNSIISTTDSSHYPPTSLSAKTRRILFKSSHQDIPSIHLTRDEDRPFSPASLSITSSGSNWMRLETLKEVPEPLSRTNSFDIDVPLTPVNKSIRTRLDSSAFESLKPVQHRKLSDTDHSRGGTLIDEDSTHELSPHHFVNNLHAPLTYKRTLSDKSVSSCITVIDNRIPDTAALFLPITDSNCSNYDDGDAVAMSDITPPTTGSTTNNDKSISAANRRSLFGSIKSSRSCENVFSSGETPILKQATPLFLTRSAERLTVSSDNMLNDEITSYSGGANNKPLTSSLSLDINDIRKASLNESFKDFIKSLASDGSVTGSSHNGSPVPPGLMINNNNDNNNDTNNDNDINNISTDNNNDENITDNESLQIQNKQQQQQQHHNEQSTHNEDTTVPLRQQGDAKIFVNKSSSPVEAERTRLSTAEKRTQLIDKNDKFEDTPTTTTTPATNNESHQTTIKKSGYFSAALNSISNVFNRQSSASSDNLLATVASGEDDVPKEDSSFVNKSVKQQQQQQQQQKNPVSSSLFRLFNHQTLTSQNANSAFSSVLSSGGNNSSNTAVGAGGLEVELDGVSESSIDVNIQTTGSRRADSPVNDSDVPCKCPKDVETHQHQAHSSSNNYKKNHNKQHSSVSKKHVLNKGRSVESNGFEDDHTHHHHPNKDVRCPFGKNCSLLHKNGRHIYPETPTRLGVRKGSEASSIMRSRSPSITSTSIFTYEHFEYLVQQMNYLRAEMKEQSQEAASRELDLKQHFDSKFDEVSANINLD